MDEVRPTSDSTVTRPPPLPTIPHEISVSPDQPPPSNPADADDALQYGQEEIDLQSVEEIQDQDDTDCSVEEHTPTQVPLPHPNISRRQSQRTKTAPKWHKDYVRRSRVWYRSGAK